MPPSSPHPEPNDVPVPLLPQPPDLAALERLLVRIERDAQSRGWEQPSTFFLIYDERVEDTQRTFDDLVGRNPEIPRAVRASPYVAQMMFRPAFFADADVTPNEGLRTIALNVAYADEREQDGALAILSWLRQPGVVGFASVLHGYVASRACMPQDAFRRAAHGEAAVGDSPGAREARDVVVVDLTGHTHTASRLRGHPAEVRMEDPTVRGDFSTSLRILVAAVTGTVPPLERFQEVFPTLAQLRERGFEPGSMFQARLR